MAKNIIIYPSNSLLRQPGRIPYIDFDNAGITNLKVLLGANITFNNTGQTAILSIDPSNAIISIGNNLIIGSYFAVNGTQVINGTGDWIGPTTNIQGAQGAQGVTGNTGALGPTGNTGNIGVPGATGFSGSQGSAGPIGAQGPQGPQGPTGNTGAQGSIGVPGAQGSQGSPGALGPTGNVGAIGATGFPGNVGPLGPTGAQGTQGAQGAQGFQGNPGPLGATGFVGPTGFVGTTGPQGSQGSQGGQGAQGAQGAQGFQGGQGAQGFQGAPGTGPTGSPGATGPQGAQGAGGAKGTQGPQGASGGQGAQGAQGASGPAGTTCFSTSTSFYTNSSFCCTGLKGSARTFFYQGGGGPCVGYRFRTSANCLSCTCDWGAFGNWVKDLSLNSCFLTNSTCGYNTTQYACSSYSDVNLKSGIETIQNALENIMKIDAVEYDWNTKLNPNMYQYFLDQQKLHTIGLIAQNVRLYYPEAVQMNEDGYYSIDYRKLNSVLVEGIKDLQEEMEDIDKELDKLELILN